MDDNVVFQKANRNTRLAIVVMVLTVAGAAVALLTRQIYVASVGPSTNSAGVGSEQSPQTSPPLKGITSEEVRQFLHEWKSAWERKDLYAYASFYDDQFIGRNYSSRSGYTSMTREQWLKDKEQKFRGNSVLSITIGEAAITAQGDGVSVVFSQSFRSSGYADQGQKTVRLRRTSTGIKIVGEDFMPR
jgi:murein L,D-transpeptidase YafK